MKLGNLKTIEGTVAGTRISLIFFLRRNIVMFLNQALKCVFQRYATHGRYLSFTIFIIYCLCNKEEVLVDV